MTITRFAKVLVSATLNKTAVNSLLDIQLKL